MTYPAKSFPLNSLIVTRIYGGCWNMSMSSTPLVYIRILSRCIFRPLREMEWYQFSFIKNLNQERKILNTRKLRDPRRTSSKKNLNTAQDKELVGALECTRECDVVDHVPLYGRPEGFIFLIAWATFELSSKSISMCNDHPWVHWDTHWGPIGSVEIKRRIKFDITKVFWIC